MNTIWPLADLNDCLLLRELDMDLQIGRTKCDSRRTNGWVPTTRFAKYCRLAPGVKFTFGQGNTFGFGKARYIQFVCRTNDRLIDNSCRPPNVRSVVLFGLVFGRCPMYAIERSIVCHRRSLCSCLVASTTTQIDPK
jgi:hypothetical protein